MSTLTSLGMPGYGSGILHPKMLHKFLVSYRGTSRVPGDEATLATLLQNASVQTVSAQLPQLRIDSGHAGPGGSRRFKYTGSLEVVLEEDVLNNTLDLVLALADRRIDWFSIAVVQTDGNDHVLAAYDFRSAQPLTAKTALLSYYDRHKSVDGTLTDIEVDEKGNPLMTARLHASIGENITHTVSQTITFTNDMVSVYRFNSNHPTVGEFLKGLN